MNFLRQYLYGFKYRTGCCVPDLNRAKHHTTVGEVTRSFSYRRFCVPYSQKRNDCVPNAGLGRLSAIERFSGPKSIAELVEPSRAAHYYAATAQSADRLNLPSFEGKDSGTWPKDFYDSLRHYGVVPEAVWPYKNGMKRPSFSAMAKGKALPENLESVELGKGSGFLAKFLYDLQEGRFPSFATAITSEWYTQTPTSKPLQPPRNSGDIIGYHMVYACGYDATTRSVEICNSWGTGWGNGGFSWVDVDYLLDTETRGVFS